MQSILLSGPTSNIVLRETLETTFRLRRRLFLMAATIMLIALALALAVHPKYRVASTVLIMPGSEYTVRSLAGTNQSVNQSLERTEILGTEVAILGSLDLHRAVLREVGVGTVYPDLVAPPGPFARLVAPLVVLARSRLAQWLGQPWLAAPAAPPVPDPMARALELAPEIFDRDFTAAASSESNTIELAFTSKDPEVAARVLTTLERLYMERRRTLFADLQSGAVQQEAQALRDRLEEADRRLADFKVAHDISNFPARQEILLRQQGDTETGLMEAQSQVDQQKARVAQLQSQLTTTPKQITSQDVDVDTRLQALRSTLDALVAKRADFASRYQPASPLLQTLDAQIAARQAELAHSRADRTASAYRNAENPVYISVNTDLTHAQADLDAAQARQQKVAQQIAAIVTGQQALNRLEREFSDLERQRLQAQESYAETAKILTERRVIEQVQSTQQANARVLSEVAVPPNPAPTRKVIMLVAAFLAVAMSAVMVLASNYLRRGFLLAGSLERDCGIPVLVVIPDLNRLPGGRPGAIRPI